MKLYVDIREVYPLHPSLLGLSVIKVQSTAECVTVKTSAYHNYYISCFWYYQQTHESMYKIQLQLLSQLYVSINKYVSIFVKMRATTVKLQHRIFDKLHLRFGLDTSQCYIHMHWWNHLLCVLQSVYIRFVPTTMRTCLNVCWVRPLTARL